MVKFKGVNSTGKEVLGIGLSKANLHKLCEGMPILIDQSDFFDGEVLIVYGSTENEIVRLLKINDNIKLNFNNSND